MFLSNQSIKKLRNLNDPEEKELKEQYTRFKGFIYLLHFTYTATNVQQY